MRRYRDIKLTLRVSGKEKVNNARSGNEQSGGKTDRYSYRDEKSRRPKDCHEAVVNAHYIYRKAFTVSFRIVWANLRKSDRAR